MIYRKALVQAEIQLKIYYESIFINFGNIHIEYKKIIIKNIFEQNLIT